MSIDNPTVEERYQQLKAEFDEIDKKYSRVVNDVELDFPENLGLVKLQFTPTQQDDLTQLATNYYQGLYNQKLADATHSNMQNQLQKNNKLQQITADFDKNCQTLQQKYQQKVEKFVDKAIANCIRTSSIYQQQLDKLLSEYQQQVQQVTSSHAKAVENLNQSLQLLQDLLSQTTQFLQSQKQAKTIEKLFDLNLQEARRSDSVTKYNNSVDKQEADYQVKIQKAYATVLAAEQRRALEAINLLATVGVAGLERLKAEEKLTPAKEFFSTLPRAQAQQIFNGDDTLEYHFSTYYAYMQEYVNNLPL